METAVLTRAMMQDVDCNSNPLNAELEVKKLQELVRKLERQNEQLRTRAQPLLTPATAGEGCRGGLPELDLRYFPLQGEDLGYFEASVEKHEAGTEEEDEEEDEEALLDELELLDLDSMCSSEDSQETWLYMSQKSTDSSDSALSPLQWCRRALNSPKSELKNSRRSLSLRLEQDSCGNLWSAGQDVIGEDFGSLSWVVLLHFHKARVTDLLTPWPSLPGPAPNSFLPLLSPEHSSEMVGPR